jgi:hypothetical protein
LKFALSKLWREGGREGKKKERKWKGKKREGTEEGKGRRVPQIFDPVYARGWPMQNFSVCRFITMAPA